MEVQCHRYWHDNATSVKGQTKEWVGLSNTVTERQTVKQTRKVAFILRWVLNFSYLSVRIWLLFFFQEQDLSCKTILKAPVAPVGIHREINIQEENETWNAFFSEWITHNGRLQWPILGASWASTVSKLCSQHGLSFKQQKYMASFLVYCSCSIAM